jgi:hypothetical protein
MPLDVVVTSKNYTCVSAIQSINGIFTIFLLERVSYETKTKNHNARHEVPAVVYGSTKCGEKYINSKLLLISGARDGVLTVTVA